MFEIFLDLTLLVVCDHAILYLSAKISIDQGPYFTVVHRRKTIFYKYLHQDQGPYYTIYSLICIDQIHTQKLSHRELCCTDNYKPRIILNRHFMTKDYIRHIYSTWTRDHIIQIFRDQGSYNSVIYRPRTVLHRNLCA
jgi:hypothetical protein